MRRLFACLTFFVVAAVPAAAAPPAFYVEGRGWGHGIGMAQYGAQGFAVREGRSHAWILAHYYRGTKLAPAPVAAVRVLLADGRRSVRIGSDAPFSVTDANGRTFQLAARTVELEPGLRITVGGEQKTLASPARFARGSRHLSLGGREYRGQLVVHRTGGALTVVNHVGLEEYLYGVVPDEMPPSWHMEALKAQAVAARSYAVVSRRTGGLFDLYADTRSQVYGGVRSEETRTNAAIDATAGRVVTYGGRVAHTFFHSTSGGRTAAIQDVWDTAALPYLVSVPDPYDTISPYHSWGPFRYTAGQLRARLGSAAPAGPLVDAVVARNRSGRVEAVTAHGGRGISRLSGTSFQSRLGLRSSWFSISVLALRGDTRVAPRKAAVLRGVARGPRTASLERRTSAGWARVRALRRMRGGAFRTIVRPTETTWYRIASPKGVSPAHRVVVGRAQAGR